MRCELVGIALLCSGGCRQLLGLTDLPRGDAAMQLDAADAPVRDDREDGSLGAWGTPGLIFAPTGQDDDDPSMTGDLLELYFNRTGDIYVSNRSSVGSAWATPTKVIELSSNGLDTTPEVSTDGLTIYLASSRAGTLGSDDLMVATRPTRVDSWGVPAFVPGVNSIHDETGPAVPDDGLALVFASARGGGGNDLYQSERTTLAGAWSAPAVITELSSGPVDASPFLSGDGLTIYFYSARAGNDDLYVATRPDRASAFSAPQAITEINTAMYLEQDPWVSPDGHVLMFTSDRDGRNQLYQATR